MATPSDNGGTRTPPRSGGAPRAGCAVLVLATALSAALLWPKVRGAREAARRTQCRGHLFKIGLALQNYHDTFGAFPPAFVADDSGRPLHSWRVLILPYLEEKTLYDRYRFDEPWDGPNNRQLAASIPRIYRCPSDGRLEGDEAAALTNCVAVTGAGTAFDAGRAISLSAITDDRELTLVVVETPGQPVHWMEPVDLPAEDFLRLMTPGNRESLPHDGVHGAFADGRSRYLAANWPARMLRALTTIAGGDDQAAEDF